MQNRLDQKSLGVSKLNGGLGVAALVAVACVSMHSLIAHAQSNAGSPPTGPSVEASAAAFKTDGPVRVEIAAAEPQVVDPVALRFDVRGRMWVIEMRDYPTGPAPGEDFDGRIKVLTDNDSDVVFETATTFADGLVFPTGLQPWREGVIVTVAGKIQFMIDTDGDGRCDKTEVWFEGFSEDNEQLRANHPLIGPDGIVYVANGLRGGKVRSANAKWPVRDTAIDLSGKDFAFNPDGGFYGAVAGNSQFGLTIDDFGNRVGCSNRNPAIETLLTLNELADDRWSGPSDALHNISKVGPESKVVPIAKAWTTSHTHEGQFSAACGVTIGLGTALPEGWQNDLVVCEPTSYAVQRQQFVDSNVGRRAERIDAAGEMLASSDTWFRPVDTTVGPDGGLYIVDMCRAVIEHPAWAPTELKEREDERWGNARGRIWRLVGTNTSATKSVTVPSDVASWTEWLWHPNTWQRQMASQVLIDESSELLIPLLLDQLKVSTASLASSSRAGGDARAIALLARRGALTLEILSSFLEHASVDLRCLVINQVRRINLNSRIDSLSQDQWLPRWLSDPSPRIRFAAIGLAGDWIYQSPTNADVGDIAKLIALTPHHVAMTPHLTKRLATLSPDVAAQVLIAYMDLDLPQPATTQSRDWVFQTARRAAWGDGFGDASSTTKDLESQRHAESEFVDANDARLADATFLTAGWCQGHLAARRSPSEQLSKLGRSIAAKWILLAKHQSIGIASDPAKPIALRIAAIDVVEGFELPRGDLYETLLTGNSASTLQLKVLPWLLKHHQETTLRWIAENVTGIDPELRLSVIEQMTRNDEMALTLLTWLESGSLPATFVSLSQADRLTQFKNDDVASRASEIFQAARKDRLSVIADYQRSLSGTADLANGKALFVQHCATCHRIGAVGVEVGPDISDSRTKTPASLLTAILDPSAAVDAGFLGYQVLLVDGVAHTGSLVSQSDQHVSLMLAGGDTKVFDRDDIDQLRSTGISLMPEGFERTLSIDQMRHLIGYLKGWRYLGQGETTLALDNL
ncbi:c-type cytochrome [Rubripirellula amarantea]|nr:c-type cytochrome [Rubripirellula amarantea]